MQHGLLFYWTVWTAWVVVTFLLPKERLRTELAILILLVLIGSARTLTLYHFQLNAALPVILIYCYWKLSGLKRSKLVYTVAVSHIVTLAYMGFSMYTLYDPAVLWIDRKWMTAVLIFLAVQFMVRSFVLRIVAAVIGTIHGNVLLALTLSGLSLSVLAGSLHFFDMLACCLSLMLAWKGYEQLTHYLHLFVKRTLLQKGHYPK
ncbi:MAG TPA: hypothetical protein VFK27_06275 [Bacillales bacterium]|nr:hypothetical protein [Bacillales bacterium]